MDFGGFIKKIRESKGWSQEQLAIKCGMSTAWVQAIEYGRVGKPARTRLAAIAQALGVPESELESLKPTKREGAGRRIYVPDDIWKALADTAPDDPAAEAIRLLRLALKKRSQRTESPDVVFDLPKGATVDDISIGAPTQPDETPAGARAGKRGGKGK